MAAPYAPWCRREPDRRADGSYPSFRRQPSQISGDASSETTRAHASHTKYDAVQALDHREHRAMHETQSWTSRIQDMTDASLH